MSKVRGDSEVSVFGNTVRHARWPSVWARDVLSFHADEKQIELLDSDELDQLVVWSRQTGKTETAAALVSHYAIHNEDTLTIITSATQRQGTIVTARIQADLRLATGELALWQKGKEYEVEERDILGNVRIVRISVMSLTLSNGSSVIAIPPSPDSARGYAPNMVLIDEAARTRDALWHAVSPMRAARRVRLIAMTTASAMEGWFYDLWQHDPDVAKSEYVAADCSRINADFLAKEKRRLPEFIYLAEYENKWFLPEDRALDPELIRDMFSEDVQPMFDAPSIRPQRPSYMSDEVQPL